MQDGKRFTPPAWLQLSLRVNHFAKATAADGSEVGHYQGVFLRELNSAIRKLID
jgi:hypothetical protein